MMAARGILCACFLLFSPGAARAEVCSTQRPDWDGTPATALSEAIALFGSPLGLALLIATAFAIRFRNTWGGLAVTVGWTAFVTMVITLDPEGVKKSAMTEGCIGEPTLFIAISIAICIATILLTARPKGAAN